MATDTTKPTADGIKDGSAAESGDASFSKLPELKQPGLNQYLLRTEADGNDTLVCYFRCYFAANSRRCTLHLPIWPTMAEPPQVSAVAIDNAKLRIRVTDRQRFGLRLELNLDEPAPDNCSQWIEIIAESPSLDRDENAKNAD